MYAMVVALLIISAHEAISLKLKHFYVPAAVKRGDSVWLNCSYDLEKDKLYSIKWTKNNIEFYRYLPADTPPGQKYDLAGIHLDLSRSREGTIFLSRTDVDSEGVYRCEVSTEDLFQTVRREREMKIYVSPKSPPKITELKELYLGGETINATCISSPSRPVAILKWWINGIEALNQHLHGPYIDETPDGLFIATLILSFKANSRYFWGGKLRLICEAIVFQAHKLRSKEILLSKKFLPRIMYSDYDTHKDGPTISGGKSRYDIGDIVDVKCTASKSQTGAELHWYINGKEAKSDFLVSHEPIYYIDGSLSSVLGLRFEVRHRHYHKGEMKLRCTATLSDVVKMTSEPQETEISEQHMSDWHVDPNGCPGFIQDHHSCEKLYLTWINFIFVLTAWTVF